MKKIFGLCLSIGVLFSLAGCETNMGIKKEKQNLNMIGKSYNQWNSKERQFFDVLYSTNFYLAKEKAPLTQKQNAQLQKTLKEMEQKTELINANYQDLSVYQSVYQNETDVLSLIQNINQENNQVQAIIASAQKEIIPNTSFIDSSKVIQTQNAVSKDIEQSNQLLSKISNLVLTINQKKEG